MHYGDKNCPKPILEFVVYKHEDGDEHEFHYDITSIQRAEYVNSYAFGRLFDEEYRQWLFDSVLKDYDAERWYLIKCDTDEWEMEIEDVSEHENELYKLH